MSGIEFLAFGSDFKEVIVDNVQANSVATRAGVRRGDVLESVDDKPAADLGLEEVRHLMRTPGSHIIKLTRGSKVITVELILKRVI